MKFHKRNETDDNGERQRLASFDGDEVGLDGGADIAPPHMKEKVEEKVTWMSLPCKKQLIVLTLARLSEPLVQTSLQVSLLNVVKHFRCLVGYLWLEGYG